MDFRIPDWKSISQIPRKHADEVIMIPFELQVDLSGTVAISSTYLQTEKIFVRVLVGTYLY